MWIKHDSLHYVTSMSLFSGMEPQFIDDPSVVLIHYYVWTRVPRDSHTVRGKIHQSGRRTKGVYVVGPVPSQSLRLIYKYIFLKLMRQHPRFVRHFDNHKKDYDLESQVCRQSIPFCPHFTLRQFLFTFIVRVCLGTGKNSRDRNYHQQDTLGYRLCLYTKSLWTNLFTH